MTSAGMANVADAPWGVGGYDEAIAGAARLEVADGLTVSVASLEAVIRSKKAMVSLAERILRPANDGWPPCADGRRNPRAGRQVRCQVESLDPIVETLAAHAVNFVVVGNYGAPATRNRGRHRTPTSPTSEPRKNHYQGTEHE